MHQHRRLINKLLLTVVGMFGFGFALVPLYDVFCDLTGLNGKVDLEAQAVPVNVEIDRTRTVKVQFSTSTNAQMSWEFEPMLREIDVHPGEMTQVSFYVRNPSFKTMVAQAIPNVMPGLAAPFLHKTECFCFRQQQLKSGEYLEMPVVFFVDPELDRDIRILTLSYTLFDITSDVIEPEVALK